LRRLPFLGGKKQLDAADLSQVYAYINQLEREGELSNKTRVKPVATKNDLDILIAMVFSDTFALNLSGVRLILNLALYMNLYVDSCGRGSDLAWGGPTVVAKPNHCLCWDHCDFYVVCLDDGDRVIAANITLEYQKGQTTSDEKKTITLRLLPTVMAMQDSLRLLVTLAIIDGVFGAGATWADLLAVDPGKHFFSVVRIDAVNANARLKPRCPFLQDSSVRWLRRSSCLPVRGRGAASQWQAGRKHRKAWSYGRV